MRVLRDVVVDRSGDSDLFAVSVTPGVVGEEMSLELITGVNRRSLRVRVVDSRPVIIAGTVQHRLQLVMLEGFDPTVTPMTDVVTPRNLAEPV